MANAINIQFRCIITECLAGAYLLGAGAYLLGGHLIGHLQCVFKAMGQLKNYEAIVFGSIVPLTKAGCCANFARYLYVDHDRI